MGITQAGDKRTGVAHPTSKRERQARRGSVERQCKRLEQDNDDVCGRIPYLRFPLRYLVLRLHSAFTIENQANQRKSNDQKPFETNGGPGASQ